MTNDAQAQIDALKDRVTILEKALLAHVEATNKELNSITQRVAKYGESMAEVRREQKAAIAELNKGFNRIVNSLERHNNNDADWWKNGGEPE